MLELAWRNVWRNRRRSLVTLLAVALSVALALIAGALTEGWYDGLVHAATRLDLGHLQIHARGYMPHRPVALAFDGARGLAEARAAGVAAAPRVLGAALAGNERRSTSAFLVGIDPSVEGQVTALGEAIGAGKRLGAAAAREALLGARLAKRLNLDPGATLVVMAEDAEGSPAKAEYHVVGTVHTGDEGMDRSLLLLHIDDARALLGLGTKTHEIAVVVADARRPEAAQARLLAVLGSEYEVASWKELRPVVFGTLRLANGAMWVVLLVIFGLAGLGIANVVTMSVLERTREIGLLLALGMAPIGVVGLILAETLFLVMLAALGGGALGLAIAAWFSGQGLDLTRFGPGIAQGGVTLSPVIHARVTAAQATATLLALCAMAVLSALGPALRAARLPPAEAGRGR